MDKFYAVIARDDNFVVTGFNIEVNEKNLFHWGSTCSTEFYYVKRISIYGDNLLNALEILRLNQEIRDLDNNLHDFLFNCINEEQKKVLEKAKLASFNVSTIMDKKKACEKKLLELIGNFK